MAFSARPLWQLQQDAQEIVSSHDDAVAAGLVVEVRPLDAPTWDEECLGVGEDDWTWNFLTPNGRPSEWTMMVIKAQLEQQRKQYRVSVAGELKHD